eukprot:jgi/Astpho2/4344/e_gw1.00065.44.1_t
MGSSSNYYDVHDILAGETLIPVQLTTAVKGCGRALDPSSDHEDLREGTAVELPLWLLPRFTCENWVHVKLPRWFGRKMQRKLEAGAGCEDLRTRCPYFYTVAEQLSALCTQDRLAPFVIKTFINRYKELLTRAHTTDTGPETTRMRMLLCVEEAKLFEAGRHSIKAVEAWR